MNDTVLNDYNEMTESYSFEGVRTGRFMSFLIDYAIVLVLCIPASILIFLLGIPTLGLAWVAFPVMVPAIAVIYVAWTMGGEQQATIGMRMNGLRAYKIGGGPVDRPLAGLHHILFLIIQGFAVFLPLLVSLFSSRKRLLHDIALGTFIARA
jgi:uncharacterized RDD family membrane protein YckC